VDQRENTAANGTRNLADEDLTRAVLASFGNTKSGRFREVVHSLVRHVHAFVSEVKLTEEEWFKGIDFLTKTGHITDDERQEFILLSDVLGVSMLVVGINHRRPMSTTESAEAVEVVGRATDRHPTGTT
jgi:hydroxyquinol 1,2-dioxygenase